MRRSSRGATAVAVMMAAVAISRAEAQPAQAPVHARFLCGGGKSIDATFVNGASSHVKLTPSDGRTLTVPQAQSASGARYANANESFVFWNKGDTAFIDESGKTTYDGCTTKR